MGYGIFRTDLSENQVFEVEVYRLTVLITPKMNGLLDGPQTPTSKCTPIHP